MDKSTPSIQTPKPQNNNKRNMLIAVVLLFFAGVSIGFFSQYKTLQATQNSLDEANASITSLEDEAKTLRDKKRVKDLELFTYAFRQYKSKNDNYPSTEGSMSQKIYKNTLSKFVTDFTEPTTDELYGFEAIAQVHTPSPLELGVIQYQLLGQCNPSDGDFIDTESIDDAAIRTVLESGETYCLNI